MQVAQIIIIGFASVFALSVVYVVFVTEKKNKPKR